MGANFNLAFWANYAELWAGGEGSTLVCIQSGNVKLRHFGAIKSHFQHMAQWSG